MGSTRGAGAGGEGDLQSPVRVSDRETTPRQDKIAVGRLCSSGRHIPGGQRLAGFGQGSRSVEDIGQGGA